MKNVDEIDYCSSFGNKEQGGKLFRVKSFAHFAVITVNVFSRLI